MIDTPNTCQEQFNKGKISMYPQSDNAMQIKLKTISLLKFVKEK